MCSPVNEQSNEQSNTYQSIALLCCSGSTANHIIYLAINPWREKLRCDLVLCIARAVSIPDVAEQYKLNGPNLRDAADPLVSEP